MSDIEEPPSKVTKFQLEPEFLESEVLEEHQEDWLTEGVLTDDEYSNNVSQHTQSNSTQDSQEAVGSGNDSMEQLECTEEVETEEYHDQEEETIQQGDSEHNTEETARYKPEISEESNSQEEHKEITGEEESTETTTAEQQPQEANDQPVDIEEVLSNMEKAKNNNQSALPEALNAFLIRKPENPASSAPQPAEQKADDDDGNDTDDLLRMLGEGDEKKVHKLRIKKRNSGARGGGQDQESSDDEFVFTASQLKTMKVVKGALQRCPPTKAQPEDDLTDAQSTDEDVKHLKKIFASDQPPRRSKPRILNLQRPTKPSPAHSTPLKQNQARPRPVKVAETKAAVAKQSVLKQAPQPAPELMDEEVPEDSDSDDQSIYDEILSDESEGLDDWFTIDIRAERAGDYLPLLGDKAYELLHEEKRRVEAKLTELRKKVATLTESAKTQAEESRKASSMLSQLDTLLKTT